MRIGVDLRVLQVGHQYRGIGEVAKRTLNEMFILSLEDDKQDSFVFFEFADMLDPKEFLNIPKYLKFEVVKIGLWPKLDKNRTMLQKLAYKWSIWFGNPIPAANKCDVFLQYDYALGVPTNTKSVLIEHDIIPYIFWNDYFTSPWLHVKHKAARTTIRTFVHNIEYKHILKRSAKNATKIICVSEHTRKDLKEYLHISMKKMTIIHLGVSKTSLNNEKAAITSGQFPDKPYLLFIGAVDARRRVIDDIIDAFNNLKAEGHDIQLVLAGENFQSPEAIPNDIVRNAIYDSSYKEDILTLGYIDDNTKNKLFKNAIAFVFPTTYEGFGIPVLEAMANGCPVIVYKNSSIPEIAGEYAIYAKGWEDIYNGSTRLLSMSDIQKDRFIRAAQKHAKKFTWLKTSIEYYDALKSN